MGTHYNKMKDKPISILHGFAISLLCLHILIHSPHFVAGQKGDQVPISLSDFRALQSIRENLIDTRGSLVSWNMGSRNETCSPGKWVGIRCMNGQVVAIHLPFKSLRGTLSSKIGMLKGLRSLSLHDNLIGGPIPSSLGSLPNLRGLYLFSNQFSGSIPPFGNSSHHLVSIDLGDNLLSGSIPPLFLAGSPRVRRLNLSYNSLSGSIPPSLGKLANLEVLSLSHNRMNGTIPYSIANLSSMTLLDLSQNNFSGQIPVALENLSNLTYLNVSNNQLSGKVPRGLAKKFKSSSFEGNLQLCGFSGSTPCPSTPPPPMAKSPPPPSALPKKHHRKLSIKDIILILMGSMIAILLLVSCVLVYCLVRKREGAATTATGGKILTSAVAGASRGDEAGQDGGGKLVIFDGAFEFTADDLLSATAETMGKSPYGTMYKATLEDGTQVVVKRLREKLTKGPKEFEEETTALGRIQHPNILPLRAYYLGPKGEKLLVFDYLSKGTLSSFLHARTPEMIVDWPTRMKITIGTARGLNHLHTNQNLIHGNLTSTNVYLDNETNPKIANYGLHRLMKPNSSELMTTNTKKTDIYSLGVMMLELLTGKPPAEGADGSELPQWVASMVKDERTNEVFDLELMMRRDDMAANTGEQMLNTLKLALHLVDPDPEARPEADHVVQQLEQINPDIGSA